MRSATRMERALPWTPPNSWPFCNLSPSGVVSAQHGTAQHNTHSRGMFRHHALCTSRIGTCPLDRKKFDVQSALQHMGAEPCRYLCARVLLYARVSNSSRTPPSNTTAAVAACCAVRHQLWGHQAVALKAEDALPATLHVTVRLGSTCAHTIPATARPATVPSAFARKVAVARVDSGILQYSRCCRLVSQLR
jgi:hypothetical protein